MSSLILENKLAERNAAYYDCYIKMKQNLSENYLDDIRILYPWYTDHGINHSNAILNTLCNMIAPQNTSIDVRNESLRKGDIPSSLSDEDIFVLLCASLWHDVGMLISREDHARQLIKYVTEIQRFVDDKNAAQTIYDVACAHSSDKKFDECVNFLPLKFGNKDVNVSKKTLAALLRIADEISEDERRITKTEEVFRKIPKENRIFWEHSASIAYSEYRNNKIIIRYTVDIDKAFARYTYEHEGKKTITLYMFIINRICKIVNELIVCAPYFSSICRIDSLNITIEFQKQNNWICEELITEFSKDIRPFLINNSSISKQTQEFFKLYNDFDPKEIKRKIRR